MVASNRGDFEGINAEALVRDVIERVRVLYKELPEGSLSYGDFEEFAALKYLAARKEDRGRAKESLALGILERAIFTDGVHLRDLAVKEFTVRHAAELAIACVGGGGDDEGSV